MTRPKTDFYRLIENRTDGEWLDENIGFPANVMRNALGQSTEVSGS